MNRWRSARALSSFFLRMRWRWTCRIRGWDDGGCCCWGVYCGFVAVDLLQLDRHDLQFLAVHDPGRWRIANRAAQARDAAEHLLLVTARAPHDQVDRFDFQ